MTAASIDKPETASCEASSSRKSASSRTLRGLDVLNFLLADVQTGVGPFLAIYLAEQHWNEQRVGLAMTVGGLAGIATQTPAGGLVDRLRAKRAIIVAGLIGLAIGAAIIAAFPFVWPVLSAEVVIGGMSSVFIPTIAAISMGLAGHAGFDARQGRNQAFNSAGNVFAALSMGAIGYFSNRGIFLFVIAMTIPTILVLRMINADEIDHELARGCQEGGDETPNDAGKPAGLFTLLRDRSLLIFLICCVLFHFANAAMLPLLGQMLSKGKGSGSMMFMSACVVTTQLMITFIASPLGRLAERGRKRLLLIGFLALPIRGVLYTFTTNEILLIAIQLLDGVGAGIFNVVSVLVIADLTRGTGRFNLAQGAIATAVGLGAALSQYIAGSIVHHAGYNAGFLFLAGVALAAFVMLWCFMPETKATPAT